MKEINLLPPELNQKPEKKTGSSESPASSGFNKPSAFSSPSDTFSSRESRVPSYLAGGPKKEDQANNYTNVLVVLGAVLVISYLIYLGTVYRQQSYKPEKVLVTKHIAQGNTSEPKRRIKLFMTGHPSPPHDEKSQLSPKIGKTPLRYFHGKKVSSRKKPSPPKAAAPALKKRIRVVKVILNSTLKRYKNRLRRQGYPAVVSREKGRADFSLVLAESSSREVARRISRKLTKRKIKNYVNFQDSRYTVRAGAFLNKRYASQALRKVSACIKPFKAAIVRKKLPVTYKVIYVGPFDSASKAKVNVRYLQRNGFTNATLVK
ncbi:MAG: SPOR domain-containing protein [bacterium]